LREEKNNSKKLWSTVKDLLHSNKNSDKIHSVKTSDGTEIVSDKEIANSFNNFFVTIGSTLAKNFTSTTTDINIPVVNNTFNFKEITPYQVSKILSSLKNGKATGMDGLCVRSLKAGNPVLCHPLAYIYNLSLSSATVPTCWKTKRISPLHKGGNLDDVNNYRPISILPVPMKIFEKLVFEQLLDYIMENEIISVNQSGFRKSHSTETAALEVKEFILNQLSEGKLVGAVLIDFKKAFDTVDHKILLKKLFCYDFRDISFDWLESYLSDRFQVTKVNGCTSDLCCEEAFGVPQGSVLGPLFFLLYINDINKALKSYFHLYADDTILIHSSNCPGKLKNDLEAELNDLSKWLEINKLTLNMSKTEAIFFGNKNKIEVCKDIEVCLKGEPVKKKQHVKYLGVYFDEKLDWSTHLSILKGKGYSKLKKIKYLAPSLTPETKTLLINTLVLPYINYCSLLWSTSSKTEILKVQKLLDRALIFSQARERPIEDIFHLHTSLLTFKCLHNLCPVYLKNKVKLVRETHRYGTRSSESNNLVTLNAHNKFLSQTFQYRAPKIWNSLPNNIKSIQSLLQFKGSVKKHFTNLVLP
jgi:hypothetical protein